MHTSLSACKCAYCTRITSARLRDINRSLNYSWYKHIEQYKDNNMRFVMTVFKTNTEAEGSADQSNANATDNDNQ